MYIIKYINLLFLLSILLSCGNNDESKSYYKPYSYTPTEQTINEPTTTTYDTASDRILKQLLQDSLNNERNKAVEIQTQDNINLASLTEEQSDKIDNLEKQNNNISRELENEKVKYYFYGSKNQLFDKDILDKGGLLKRRDLNEDLNKNYLIKTDINKTQYCVYNKIKRIYPDRSSDSYDIEDGCLIIIDIEKFWALTEILIIETK